MATNTKTLVGTILGKVGALSTFLQNILESSTEYSLKDSSAIIFLQSDTLQAVS